MKGEGRVCPTVYDAVGRPVWHRDPAGFISYTAYDERTGAVVKTITDVDTTQTGDFANLPSGWTTPTGGGLHLTTLSEVDGQGRATKVTHPGGRVDYTVYDDREDDGDPNLFWYVGNGPVNRVDPSGLDGPFAGVFAPGGQQERYYRERGNKPPTVERRVWAVSTEDRATAFAIGWHSFTATLNSLQPFGASDSTIRTPRNQWNLPGVVREMERRGLLDTNTEITFFEIAGHNPGGAGNLIPHPHINPNRPEYNSPEAQATGRAISAIAARMPPDAEIRLNACCFGGNDSYM